MVVWKLYALILRTTTEVFFNPAFCFCFIVWILKRFWAGFVAYNVIWTSERHRTWWGLSESKPTRVAPTWRLTSGGTIGRRSQSAATASFTAPRRFSSPITSMFRAPTQSKPGVRSTASRVTRSSMLSETMISYVVLSTIPPSAPSILIELLCESITTQCRFGRFSYNLCCAKFEI